MLEKVQWGSPAITLLEPAIDNFVNPNTCDVVESKELRYKVHKYINSIYTEYNDMNLFEFEVAEALDKTDNIWYSQAHLKATVFLYQYMRQISHTLDPILYSGVMKLYRLSILRKAFADTAITTKMLDLSDIGIQIAFILE
ncbi:hypothetical protein [Clostridium sp. DL-VIII]|uniref:hypothetical protein n=1 Tax=Clostridium sp. DL-VIII TaxID=641107 RepID=UPI00163E1771|nr:hypothetical protein [Clostridium sp. DL-VIII]